MPAKKPTGKKLDSNRRVTRTKKAVKESTVTLTDPTKEGLSPQEQSFCEIYVSPTEFYGNGTQSYIEAFSVELVKGSNKTKVPKGMKAMTIEAVRQAAYKLLTKTDILTRINELLEEGGLNDQFADKQLKHLITQHADPRVQLAALAEYNKLKSRIVTQQNNLHSFANDDMSDEELMRVIAEKQKFFNKK